MPHDPPVTSSPPPAHDVRVLARGVLAGAATELALTGAFVLLWFALRGGRLSVAEVLLFSLGAGLAVGLAWGVAEGLAARVRRPWLGASLGLLAGVVLAPAAPMVGEYVLHLHATGKSMAALDRLLASLDPLPSPWAFLAGAACLYGPLLFVRRLDAPVGFTREALAMSLGVVAWGVVLEVAALAGARVGFGWPNLSLLLVLLLGRALVFPLCLRGADLLCASVGRRARGEVVDPAGRARTVAPRTPSMTERSRARWHDDRASALPAADAAAERALAYGLWPTPERALSLARAHAIALAVEPALAALEDALALAGGRATSFDPVDPTWEALRGHLRFEALAPRATARAPLGPGARLLLTVYVTTVALAAAAPAVFAPAESAELTRLRVHAWLTGDGAAWESLGERLVAGDPADSSGYGALEWLPGVLARVGVSPPGPSPELALGAFLRSAEAGHPPGMVRAAAALACYPDRQLEAAVWCRRAAEAGDPEGMWRWSRTLRGGWFGMATDEAAGSEWLRRAAEAGCEEAQVDLGRSLARRGDVPAARTWFERAMSVGHGTAEDELAALEGTAAVTTWSGE